MYTVITVSSISCSAHYSSRVVCFVWTQPWGLF